EEHLARWLDKGYAGEMTYLLRHGKRRSRPAELIPGTRSIISLRLDYLPGAPALAPEKALDHGSKAYVSRYALGRDYHKVIRKRLSQLQARIEAYVHTHDIHYQGARVFTDSAPVLEKALAQKAGLGWIGKNTLLINRSAGSWFFLGEIYTSLELPVCTVPASNHCGSCDACIRICPTSAIVAPYELDARRCISYLTIEYKGSIPVNLRPLIGNRIFGCDDCQLICPWNKFARHTSESDFSPRHRLDTAQLLSLTTWTQNDFLKKTEGSAIRRCGYAGWKRNLYVGLGNAAPGRHVLAALEAEKSQAPGEVAAEHLAWAIERQRQGLAKKVSPDAKSDPGNI
ncbi:MAG: tRNA epoxyqueuosine(34) reductase QueG, partial [Gammaproteobacteria bacterium]|nr:tRNA epoxyqueuosine(34) reductase QueG [Gammaproteobacteria bacterium]